MPKLCRLAAALCVLALPAQAGPSATVPVAREAAAQASAPAAGAPKSARDGVYSRAQATRGGKVYDDKCAGCHPIEAFTDDAFLAAWQGQTAHALFDLIRTTMPQENPGGLRRQDYADLVAYLFHSNRLPAGSAELAASDEALKKVIIEAPVKKEP